MLTLGVTACGGGVGVSDNDVAALGEVEKHAHNWIAPATTWTDAYRKGTFGRATDRPFADLTEEYKGMVQATLGVSDPDLRHAAERIVATYRLKLAAIGEINDAVAGGDVDG